jgi:DNA replicative helicase MCM subunit Mcm2 (Cdc46/Mcm family)
LPKLNKKSLIPIVFADEVEYENKNELTANQKDVEAIHRFVKQKGPKVIESLVNMFDKSIIGNDLSKEALLYSLVSAGNDLDDIKNKKPRSRLNVLLAGNPGLAKSSLLKKTVTLIPNSRYESVQHSSAKSLTAIVLNEDEHHFLRLGPIPYAKGSICALNELGTMKEEEQSQLLDIMKEGEFTINKFGHNRKIQAPTAIIASSNFKDSIYDFNVTQYLDLLPLEKQLVDRFDIIVIIKDNYRDSKALEEYTDKKIELLSNNVPIYDIFLQNYIEYARRKIIKKFSHGTLKMIKDYYIGLCKSSFTTESNRKLETIIRLCKAVAKLKLKEIVEAEDVIQATRFYSALVYNSIHTRAPIPKDPVNLAIEECIAILKDKKDNSIVYTDLLMQVCGKNESVKSYLLGSSSDKMKDQTLLSIDKNKKVRNILDILRNNKDINVVNRTPIKLQFKEQIVASSGSERSDWSEQIATANASINPNVME